jgi:hypothetical protein
MSEQPQWELIANLGDVNPVDHGGFFVYCDVTGQYECEVEILEAPEDEEAPEGWTVYRFSLDRCTFTDGVLSDNPFHPEIEAWFADRLDGVASFVGQEFHSLVRDLCSDDPIRRANAYRAIVDYFGPFEFDQYPLTFTDRAEIESRYSTPEHTP